MSWNEELSQIDDAYLVWDIKTMELIGLIEADKDGRRDMQIAMMMNQMGYVMMRLNFDELVDSGMKFKNKIQVQRATEELLKGLDV